MGASWNLVQILQSPLPPGRTIWHVKYLDLVLTISTCIGCFGDLFRSGWTPCNWLRRVTQVTRSLFLFATGEKREQNYSQRRLLAWLAAAAAHSRKTCLLSSFVTLSLSLSNLGGQSLVCSDHMGPKGFLLVLFFSWDLLICETGYSVTTHHTNSPFVTDNSFVASYELCVSL